MVLPVGVALPNYGPLAGAEALSRLARHAEALGFDSLWVADHLVMPCDATSRYPFDRRAEPTPARLDGLVDFYEPLVTLAYVAGITRRIRLGVSVYVMPYRNPVVTAKLVATLDALSGGRVIFGAGVGWLREEFLALGADPGRRGRVTDEYLEVCRRLWRDDVASFDGAHYHLPPVRTGPKPAQRPWPPIWIGGNSEAAYRRVGRLGDGWLASRVTDAAGAREAIEAIHRHAEQAGRDPGAIGLQSMVAPPPRDAAGKTFYADHDAVVARVAALKAMGFGWVALNATAIFQAGARSVEAITEQLGRLHDRLRAEVG